jgi:hypothetical protein
VDWRIAVADSPAHAFGQKLGEFLEILVEYLLTPVATKHGLYLDRKGPRPARGNLKKATWTDKYGSKHDLDYVLERGGSVTKLGDPIAFVEAAWRKGTRHSKNKVQEIQGAILPLVETNSHHAPFAGVILAGDFTAPSIQQLKNLKFKVLYFTTNMVARAFQKVGLDITSNDTTPDSDYSAKIATYNALTQAEHFQVIEEMIALHQQEVDEFIKALEQCLTRQITLVRVLPLHGVSFDLTSIVEAIDFIDNYSATGINTPALKFEVEIRYGNGDKIQATLSEKEDVLAFLHT